MHQNILQEVISLYHQDMSKNQLLEVIKFTLNHLCLNFIASLLMGGGRGQEISVKHELTTFFPRL